MKIHNDKLRHTLAAEYVLGTLSGRVRRRFQAHLRHDPALRRIVADWERRLTPLSEPLSGMAPPARVWKAIQRRLFGRAPSGIWSSLAFWRIASLAAGAAVLAIGLYALAPKDAIEPVRMVAVMSDEQNVPAMTVSWTPEEKGERVLRVHVIAHADMAPGTTWELWMLPGGNEPPASLGLITTHATQMLVVPAHLAPRIDQAWGLAMSIEPPGGSPTGLPTGPILYKGACVRA
jgi:anti-sigma-K factor RskA